MHMLNGKKDTGKKLMAVLLSLACILSTVSPAFAEEAFYWDGNAESETEETEYETELAESIIDDLTLTSGNDAVVEEEASDEEEILHKEDVTSEQEDQPSGDYDNDVVYTDEGDVQEEVYTIPADIVLKEKDSDKEDSLKVNVQAQAGNSDTEFHIYFWQYDGDIPQDADEWGTYFTEPCEDILIDGMDEFLEMDLPIFADDGEEGCTTASLIYESDDDVIKSVYLDFPLSAYMNIDTDFYVGIEDGINNDVYVMMEACYMDNDETVTADYLPLYFAYNETADVEIIDEEFDIEEFYEDDEFTFETETEEDPEFDDDFDEEFELETEALTEEETVAEIQTLAAGDTAFAVYSETDNSLTFYAGSSVPSEGSTYNGKTATNVYTGFETMFPSSASNIPWYTLGTSIMKVSVNASFKEVQPVSMEYWFCGLTNATFEGLENIDTSNVTTLRTTFNGCKNLTNADGLKEWDISNVTSLQYTFHNCSGLTSIDISGWNTSKVTNMTFMFYGCSSLETIYSDDSNFVTTKVTSGNNMFYNCRNLVGGNGTAYSSSNVTYTMAHVDTAGNPGYFTDISVKPRAFSVYSADDNSLTFYYGIVPQEGSTYNGKTVTNVYTGFETETGSSESSISWNSVRTSITKVIIDSTFKDVQPVSLAYWFNYMPYCKEIEGLEFLDTSNATTMRCMFQSDSSLSELDVSGFDTSNVTDMSYMFFYTNKISELDVSGFDTKNVTDMEHMFCGCSDLTELDVSGFDTSNVTNMYQMFCDCGKITELDVSGFDTSNVTNMGNMFNSCSSLKTIYSDDSSFVTSAVTSGGGMFTGCSNLVGGNGAAYSSSNVTYTMAHVDTENNPGYFTDVSDKPKAFAIYSVDDDSLTFYADSVIPSEGSIYNEKTVTNLFTGFDTSSYSSNSLPWSSVRENVKTVIFDSSFQVIRPISTAYWFYHFENCSSIEGTEYLNTRYVTNMQQMFGYCYQLTSLDLSSFNTSNVTAMNGMFREAGLEELNLSGFDTSKVTAINAMFRDSTNLKSIYVDKSFDLGSIDNDENMFLNCTSIVGGNGTTYNSSKITSSMAHIDTADDPGYFTGSSVAFAVYSTADNSLTFYTGIVPSVGSTYNGKTVTNVYTGFDTVAYSSASNIPWYSIRTNIQSVSFDESFADVKPIATAYWFYGMTGCTSIDTTNLDTSEVTTMEEMFWNCTSLSELDVSNWDVGNVTNMHDTFSGMEKIEYLDVSKWDVRNVTTMYGMFYNCKLLDYIPVENWKTDSLTDMHGIFDSCSGLVSIDMSGWDTSNVEDMCRLFYQCKSLESIDINGFDTSNVTNMVEMFYNCSSLKELDVSEFDTSNVAYTRVMFYNCSSLTSLDVSGWDTENVTDMTQTFYGCSSLETIYSDDNNFVTSAVTSGSGMFTNCSNLVGGNGTAYSSSKTTYTMAHVDTASNPGYFTYADKEAFAVYSADDDSLTFYYGIVPEEGSSYKGKTTTNVYTGFETQTWSSSSSAPWYSIRTSITKVVIDNSFKNVQPVSLAYWFFGMTNAEFEGLGNIDTSNVTTLYCTFYNCSSLVNVDGLSKWDISNVTTLQSTFYNCSSLVNVDGLSEWDTSKVTTLYYTFYGCSSLANVDGLSGWDTSKVTTLQHTFYKCSNLTNVDGLSEWDTSKVTTLYYTFYGCSSLANVDGLSGWDTSNVTTLYYTFHSCNNLANVDGLSEWNTSNVTTLRSTFSGCSRLTNVDALSGWNTSKVTILYYTFYDCSSLANVDISGWNTAKVTDMRYMFSGCSSLTTIYSDDSNFVTTAVTSGSGMFTDCSKLVGGNGTSYSSSKVTYTRAHVDTASNPGYFTNINDKVDVSFTWSNDLSSCTATFTWDDGSSSTVNCTITTSESIAHTCTETGEMLYTASAVNPKSSTVFTDTTTGEISPLGHDYSDVYFHWGEWSDDYTDDHTECTAYFTCTRCEDVQTVECAVTSVTEEASCTVPGNIVYTASCTFEGNDYTNTRDIVLNPLGHDFGEPEFVWSYAHTECIAIFPCQRCNGTEEVHCTISSSTTDPTCTESGSTAYTAACVLDGKEYSDTQTVEIPAIGHAYGEPEFVWSEDCYESSAVFICANCGDEQTISCEVEVYIGLDTTTFTASAVSPDGTIYSETKEVVNTAFAIYSTDDNSLTFYYGAAPSAGGSYYGQTVTNVFTGVESTGSSSSTVPWYSIRASIQFVMFDPSFENVQPVATAYWFYGMTNCTEIEGLEFLDTENVTSMYQMFRNCSSLKELDVSGFDTGNVTSMYCMFDGCSSLKELDVSGFDTGNVTTMNSMFCDCSSLTKLDLSGFDTWNVTDMGNMFYNCSSLTELDVSGFDTGDVEYMYEMFKDCDSLKEIDVSKWDTSNTIEFTEMFYQCSSLLYLDLSSFDTSKKDTDEIELFLYGCTSLLYIKIGDAFDLFEYYTARPEQKNWYDETGNLVSDNRLYGVSEAGTYYTYRTEFDWSDDRSSCTATFSDYYENSPYYGTKTTIDCLITSEVIIPASCTEDGETLFTAQAEEPIMGIVHASEKTMTYPATGHDWFETDEVQNGLSIDVYFECANCGATKHESVMAEIVSESGMSGSIDVSEIPWHELITDEELASYDDDTVIDFIIVMEDINETVPEEDASLIEELLEGERSSVFYIEIDLSMKVSTADGESTEYDLHEVPEPVTVTVAIPESMQTDKDGEYAVIRVHEGEAEVLDTTDNGDWTLTFTTDKFSTYAIAFLEESMQMVLNLGNGNGTRNFGDYSGTDTAGTLMRYTIPSEGTLISYEDEDRNVEIRLPSDSDLGNEFTVIDAVGDEDDDDYLPDVTVDLEKEAGYDYRLIGWVNIATGEYYDVSNGPVTAKIDLTDDNVFYADWISASHDYGSSSDANLRADTVSTNSFMTIHMYDYSDLFNMYSASLEQNGIESETWTDSGSMYSALNGEGDILGNSFLFVNDGTGNSMGQGLLQVAANRTNGNKWTGEGNMPRNAEECWGITSTDSVLLSLLFDQSSSMHGVEYVGEGDYLFWIDENGYYTYNSKQSAAAYSQTDQRFYLYNGTQSVSNTSFPCFLPFNKYGSTLSVKDGTVNYWFGMDMAVDFYLPASTESGGNKINDQDMVFNFSGDDDILVFIDGDIILDMSGIHDESFGSIDFTNGTVTIGMSSDSSWNITDGTTSSFSLAAGNHTLQVYYLERGGYASNLAVQFNISPLWEYTTGDVQTVTAEKVWQDGQGNTVDADTLENKYGITGVDVGLFDVIGENTEDIFGYTLNGSVYTVQYTDDHGIMHSYEYDASVPSLTFSESGAEPVIYSNTDENGRVVDNNGYVISWLENDLLHIRIDMQTLNEENGWTYAWELLDPDGQYETLELSKSSLYTTETFSDELNTYYYWSVIGEQEVEENLNTDGFSIILTDAADQAVETLGDTKDAEGWVIVADNDGITTKKAEFSQIATLETVETNGQSTFVGTYGVTSTSAIDALGSGAVWYTVDSGHQDESIGATGAEGFYLYCLLDGDMYYLTAGSNGTPLGITNNPDEKSEFFYDTLGEFRAVRENSSLPDRIVISADGEISFDYAELAAAINDVRIFTLKETETSGFAFTAVNTVLPDIVIRKADDHDNIIAGAVFNITDKDGNTLLFVGSEDDKYDMVYKPDENGTADLAAGYIRIEGLPAGTYFLKEVQMPEGYEGVEEAVRFEILSDGTVDGIEFDGNEYIASITNRELLDLSIEKTWDDSSDQDGIRPHSITLQLYSDGEPCGESVSVTGTGDTWSYTWHDLFRYNEDGSEIEYTVTEDDVEGYETVIDGMSITNIHVPDTVSVEGNKTWDDSDNQDGIRPDYITIELIADGEIIESIEVTEDDNWSWSFDDLPKYRDGGIEIQYAIMEYVNEDYSTSYGEDGEIINHYEPSLTSVSVTKYWDDNNNQDGIRAGSVTVELLADGEETGMTLTLDESNNWTSSFEDLDEYHAGTQIEYAYTIREYQIDGYDVADITGDMDEGYIITNHYEPETINISGTKTWDDDNNRDGIRPESIIVRLFADEEEIDSMTVTEADEWSYTFDDLPKYRDGGIEVIYTVSEDSVEGYETAIDGYDITNAHVPETINITGFKTWDDADNQDGKRPESISLELIADGEILQEIFVTAEDGWTWSFDDLPKYRDGGIETQYTVMEHVNEDYSTSYGEDGEIINSYEPSKTSVSVTKYWDDNDNQDGLRAGSVTVELLADGEETGMTLILDESNNWTSSFEDLDEYHAGTKIEYSYTIQEYLVDGYEISDVRGNAEDGYIITNFHEPETTSVIGTKTWDDDNDRDGIRPDSITVHLFADEEEIDNISITEEDEWSYTFDNLPKYRDGGIEIIYSITEDPVQNYETSIDGYNITNAYAPETLNIEGSKTWDDDNNRDGIRPEEITVRLYADDEEVAHMTTSEADEWKWSFEDLPKYRDGGIEIVYTISEDAVEGYETSIEGYDITNAHKPETVDVSGFKTWDDADNQDGVRPDNIIIELIADGEVIESIEVTEDDNWSWSFDDLPKYRDGGIEIQYAVMEYVNENYSTSYGENGEIINHYEPSLTSVSVTKYWDDSNNQDGLRTGSVTVELLADGEETGLTLTLDEANNWTSSFEDLDEYHAGTQIEYTYTIREYQIDGYDVADITGDMEQGYIITNHHEPETINISGTKTWDDDNNRDGIRPDSITVHLFADEEEIDSMTVTEADEWSYTFNDLPKYRDEGVEIIYTVSEDSVDGYEADIDGYDITNIHVPETVDIEGSKAWDDNDNLNGLRPEEITIRLFADEKEIDSITVNAEDDWSWQFTDLLKYRDEGTEIIYTIEEDAVDQYETVYDGYDITNRLNTYGFNLQKTDDAGDEINGAAFTLSDEDGTVLSFAAEENVYTKCADDDENAVTELPAGSIRIEGLPEGKYILKEVKSPDGYLTLKDEIILTISEDGVSVDNENDQVSVEGDTVIVENIKTSALLSTGGFGTRWMMFFAIAMIAASAALLVFCSRKHSYN